MRYRDDEPDEPWPAVLIQIARFVDGREERHALEERVREEEEGAEAPEDDDHPTANEKRVGICAHPGLTVTPEPQLGPLQ